MREISVNEIIETVKKLCIETNYYASTDIIEALENGLANEEYQIGQEILEQLIQNAQIAREKKMPICQDTGMAIVFCEVGLGVKIVGGDLTESINEGVRRGYREGYLRKSVVEDPFYRVNTKDNTPAIIHYDLISGDCVKITVAPKGFGSENMSKIHMLVPSDGIEGAKRVILETIQQAGGNACPPMVVGVGIGGSFEKSALLAKKALLRSINEPSNIPYVQELEKEMYEKANQLGIGPQGLGGKVTVLGVNIETFPTHIAGLPVAINISCHVTRHGTSVL